MATIKIGIQLAKGQEADVKSAGKKILKMTWID